MLVLPALQPYQSPSVQTGLLIMSLFYF